MGKAVRNTIVSAIADLEEAAQEGIAERDAEDKKRVAAEMQRQHRGELPALLADAARCLDVQVPDRLKWALENGRTRDGTLLLNDPMVLRWLAEIWRSRRDLSPNSPKQRGANPSEREQIEQFMRTNRAAYLKDDAMQARYRQLLAAELGGES